MTDHELGLALARTVELEQAVRAHIATTREEDLPESDAALVTLRLVTPYKRQLEHWITMRAMRAALHETSTQRTGA